MPYTPVKEYGTATKDKRERLTRYLVSLVKDQVVPCFECEQAKLSQAITEMHQQLTNVLSGHPGAPDKSAETPGGSEQKIVETATGVTNINEK